MTYMAILSMKSYIPFRDVLTGRCKPDDRTGNDDASAEKAGQRLAQYRKEWQQKPALSW
jgi:hypothetical protein